RSPAVISPLVQLPQKVPGHQKGPALGDGRDDLVEPTLVEFPHIDAVHGGQQGLLFGEAVRIHEGPGQPLRGPSVPRGVQRNRLLLPSNPGAPAPGVRPFPNSPCRSWLRAPPARPTSGRTSAPSRPR